MAPLQSRRPLGREKCTLLLRDPYRCSSDRPDGVALDAGLNRAEMRGGKLMDEMLKRMALLVYLNYSDTFRYYVVFCDTSYAMS